MHKCTHLGLQAHAGPGGNDSGTEKKVSGEKERLRPYFTWDRWKHHSIIVHRAEEDFKKKVVQ